MLVYSIIEFLWNSVCVSLSGVWPWWPAFENWCACHQDWTHSLWTQWSSCFLLLQLLSHEQSQLETTIGKYLMFIMTINGCVVFVLQKNMLEHCFKGFSVFQWRRFFTGCVALVWMVEGRTIEWLAGISYCFFIQSVLWSSLNSSWARTLPKRGLCYSLDRKSVGVGCSSQQTRRTGWKRRKILLPLDSPHRATP